MVPSNGLSCETGSFSQCHNPHRFLQPEVLRLYFPCAGTLGCVICLTPQLFLLVYLHTTVGPPSPPAAALPHILPAPAAPLLPSSFFFNSLVVRLPYSSFPGSFGYFLYLNLLLSFFWLSGRQSISTYASILARSANKKSLHLFYSSRQGLPSPP